MLDAQRRQLERMAREVHAHEFDLLMRVKAHRHPELSAEQLQEQVRRELPPSSAAERLWAQAVAAWPVLTDGERLNLIHDRLLFGRVCEAAGDQPLSPGLHIKTQRRHGYYHHGISSGADTVIHYAGELRHHEHAPVEETTLESFRKGAPIIIVRHRHPLPPDVVLERARSRLGERQYSLLTNNCEHFANWCATGSACSRQVEQAVAAGAGLVTTLGSLLLLAL